MQKKLSKFSLRYLFAALVAVLMSAAVGMALNSGKNVRGNAASSKSEVNHTLGITLSSYSVHMSDYTFSYRDSLGNPHLIENSLDGNVLIDVGAFFYELASGFDVNFTSYIENGSLYGDNGHSVPAQRTSVWVGYKTTYSTFSQSHPSLVEFFVRYGGPTPVSNVFFETNNGSSIDPLRVLSGNSIPRPQDPTKLGYSFVNWYSDENLTTVYDFNTPMPLLGTVTLYAKWLFLNVRFNTLGGSAIDSVCVPAGELIPRPQDPIKPGYVLENWYTDQNLTTVYDFSTPVPSDGAVTLYAGWADVRKYVIFESNGGTSIPGLYVLPGTLIIPPAAPVRANYVFDGWFSNFALTVRYNFNLPVNADIILYAKWLDIHRVWFITGNDSGVSTVDDQLITHGLTASVPTTPTNPGKGFGGWYTDPGFTTRYTFTTPILADTTLYAKWVVDYVIVRLIYLPGKNERDYFIERNSKLYRPAEAQLHGYLFGGWYTDGGTFENAWNFDSPVTSDLRLYVKWDIDYITVTLDDNHDGDPTYAVDVQRGKPLTIERDPERTGYVFGGWYTDPSGVEAYDFETLVENPFTLYAKWLTPEEAAPPSDLDKARDEINNALNSAKDKTQNFFAGVNEYFQKNWGWYAAGSGVSLFFIIFSAIKKRR
jgi:uncharacterized repeat protein (TIGR02543 family)